MNLVLDFDFIEDGAERGAPKIHGMVRCVRLNGYFDLAVP